MRRLVWAALTALLCLVSPALSAPPLGAFAALPAVRDVTLSPSGERIAMIIGESEDQRLLVTDDSQNALLVAKVGDSQIDQLIWAGEEHLLVQTDVVEYDRRRNAYQTVVQTFHVNLATNKSSVLLGGSHFYSSGGGGVVQTAKIDGRWYAYLIGLPDDIALKDSDGLVYLSLFRIDLETGRSTLIEHAQNEPKSWAVSPGGELQARAVFTPADNTWRLFAGGQAASPLIERPWTGDGYALLGQGRAPGSVVYIDRSGDGSALLEIAGEQVAPIPLLSGQSAVRPLLDRTDGRLLGVTLTDGDVALFDHELARRFRASQRAFPSKRVRLISYSTGFDRLIVYCDGPSESGTYWLVDIATGSAKTLGIVRPGVKDADVSPMSLFQFRATDGLEVDGVLTLPLDEKAQNLPLVVIPPTQFPGPPSAIGFDWFAQAFASRGYAVFQPNPRGVLQKGDAFRTAADGELGGKVLTDLSDGVAALAREGVADPKRVCVVGSGMGGYMALAGVTLQRGIYRCAVSVNGISSLEPRVAEFARKNLKPDKRKMLFWRRITGAADAQSAMKISPVDKADRADAPILLVHGEDDVEAPIWESRNMQRALEAASKPVEFVVIRREGHQLRSSAARAQMLAAAVAFVEKHNPAR